MAHSHHGKSAHFFFNGDFSGEVTIISNPLGKDSVEIKVDAQDILDLVARHLRSELIENIEQMDTKEILKLISR